MFLIWLVLTLAPKAGVAPGLGEGYWHTRGSQILDSGNHPIRIAGINWFGFETTKAAPGGLDVQDYKTILHTIKKNGYNTIRIPFSSQMVESPMIPSDIKFSNHDGPINTDLKDLDSLGILDKIVAYAGTQGLKIILDNHRSEAGGGPEATGLWYTDTYPESSWIEDWQMLAKRYEGDPTVIGFDLRNEPHNANSAGACWGCGGDNDWRFAAERAGNAVLAVNPKLLVFVEGVDAFENDFYWWGGNLMGVRTAPVRLNVPHQLVYSAHDYGPAESGQPWFTPGMNAASLNAVWRKHWGYISQENIAPVWLGEFGYETPATDNPTVAEAMETAWFQSLTAMLAKDTRIGWTYWALNGSDRYGLLNVNYDSTRGFVRQPALASIQAPLGIGIGSRFPTSTHAAAAHPEATTTTVVEQVQPPAPTHFEMPAVVPTSQSQVPQPQYASPIAPPTQQPIAPPATYGATSAPLPTGAPLQCHVGYTNLNDWKSGFTTGIVLRNTGSAPIQGWVLTFSFDGAQRITQLWNGRYDQDGAKVTVTNEAWNGTIAPGTEQAGIGFNAAYEGTNGTPVKFYLNGTLCR